MSIQGLSQCYSVFVGPTKINRISVRKAAAFSARYHSPGSLPKNPVTSIDTLVSKDYLVRTPSQGYDFSLQSLSPLPSGLQFCLGRNGYVSRNLPRNSSAACSKGSARSFSTPGMYSTISPIA